MNKEMRVYTKTGDDGTSGLIGGTRVEKYDLRLESYGTVDELNSWIGMIRSFPMPAEVSRVLLAVQNKLFVIGARLATDLSKTDLSDRLPLMEEDIRLLETEMDRMLDHLPPMNHFVLPGGNQAVASCHLARTVCRRAERRVCQLSKEIPIPEGLLKYLNRLSDYLFVLSREVSK
ncbi:MAG: cob(I)yrinic acid a,c-diamide adenosyltransferase, partial [Marinilabiliales bacterium]|nr:cob(I)yrinic acid a,c-diamide adenosyltransferase [Marinilabiliales bacterium]